MTLLFDLLQGLASVAEDAEEEFDSSSDEDGEMPEGEHQAEPFVEEQDNQANQDEQGDGCADEGSSEAGSEHDEDEQYFAAQQLSALGVVALSLVCLVL